MEGMGEERGGERRKGVGAGRTAVVVFTLGQDEETTCA